MQHKILFVDDEKMASQGYVVALQEEFDVVFILKAEEAFDYVKNHAEEFSGAVIDVMMPPPAGIDDGDTFEGFETGLWLLEKIQRELPTVWPFPVVILTNRLSSLVRDGLRRRDIDETTIEIYRKLETPAFTLPKILSRLIARFC